MDKIINQIEELVIFLYDISEEGLIKKAKKFNIFNTILFFD